jgi:hypothetical protein
MTTPAPFAPERPLATLSNLELGELYNSVSNDLMTAFRKPSKSFNEALVLELRYKQTAILAELNSRKGNPIGTCDKCGSTAHSISGH